MQTHLLHPTKYSESRYTGIKVFDTLCGKINNPNLVTTRDRQAASCKVCQRLADTKPYRQA